MLAIQDENADFLISANTRGESSPGWIEQAKALPKAAWIRIPGLPNLHVAYLERQESLVCFQPSHPFGPSFSDKQTIPTP